VSWGGVDVEAATMIPRGFRPRPRSGMDAKAEPRSPPGDLAPDRLEPDCENPSQTPKGNPAMLSYLSPKQIDTLTTVLRKHLRQGSWCTQRDCLAVLIGLHGCRASEVCRLKTDHWDVDNHRFEPPVLKRGASRSVPVDASLTAAIWKWRNGATCQWLLFTGTGHKLYPSHIQRFARRITNESLGTPRRFHTMRHSFAVRLYSSTRDILLVQQMLGHRSLESTLVYAKTLAKVPSEVLIRLDT
jgi:integrase